MDQFEIRKRLYNHHRWFKEIRIKIRLVNYSRVLILKMIIYFKILIYQAVLNFFKFYIPSSRQLMTIYKIMRLTNRIQKILK